MRYQICVSGSARGKIIEASHQLAYDLGKAIAKEGKTLLTGATVGLPWYAAKGFFNVKKSKGLSIGFSPANSFRQHVLTYRLPIDEFDYINFTGMDYVGRDIHLVNSSDAVITVGGRFGSLHEFSTAIEKKKVIGVLLGSGGLADLVPELMVRLENNQADKIIYDTDPSRLVRRVIERLDSDYKDFVYKPKVFKDEADKPKKS